MVRMRVKLKLENFNMTFRNEILELQELGVIKILKNGNIHQIEFGLQVYEFMQKTNINDLTKKKFEN